MTAAAVTAEVDLEIKIDPSGLYTRLGDLKPGDVFRAPKGESEGTLWMVTVNNSTRPELRHQIRTASLKVGSIAYKDPEWRIVRVRGYFRVTDVGEG